MPSLWLKLLVRNEDPGPEMEDQMKPIPIAPYLITRPIEQLKRNVVKVRCQIGRTRSDGPIIARKKSPDV